MYPSLYWAQGFSAQAQTLQALTPEALQLYMQNGSNGLQAQTAMLRRLAWEDPKAYQQRKAFLPYFLAATFREGIRRIDHLEAAQGWILDLDHAYESPSQFEALKERLWRDPRLWLLYVSPSGRGLKLLFRFAEPLNQSKQFSDCYQAFARQFARQHQLEAGLDLKTHDVTRVSFMAHDPDVRLRTEPLLLHPLSYLRLTPTSEERPPWEEVHPPEAEPTPEPPAEQLPPAPDPEPGQAWEASPRQTERPEGQESPPAKDPDDATWLEIRQTLSGDKGKVRTRQVRTPAEIEALTPEIVAATQDLGLTIKDTLDLNYGRKFIFGYQHLWAEVNVYHGKHGFSVVKSPKTGSHPELREMVYNLIYQLIFDPEGLDALIERTQEDPPWS